jgi:hypothetical protein
MHCGRPDPDSRVWRTPDAVHADLRGLEPPEPLVTVLRLIDLGEVDAVLIAHFDREPIFLYPELDDRGWSHDIVPSDCHASPSDVTLRIARYAI